MGQAIIPNTNQKVLTDSGIFTTGWSRFLFMLSARVGGTSPYNLGGRLITNTTPVGNVTGSETDLIKYTLVRNSLVNNGDILEITAYGITASNSDNKTIKLILGSTTLFTTGAIAFNNKPWCIRATLTRTGDTAQYVITTFNGDFSLFTNTATFTAASEDLTTDLIIKCTGLSGSSTTNDIVQKGLTITMFPAG